MKRIFWAFIVFISCMSLSACGAGQMLEPALAPTRTETPTPTATGTPTKSPTATVTNTPTNAATPTATLSFPLSASTPLPENLPKISPGNVGKVKQLAHWGEGMVTQLAWAPDGKILAVASSIGIYLYDPATLDELNFISSSAHISCLTFSPDGMILATGSWGGTIQLWHFPDMKLINTFKDNDDNVYSLAFSPDGSTIASGSEWGTVKLWEIDGSGTPFQSFSGQNQNEVYALAFSPDGQEIAVGAFGNDALKLWNVSDGKLLRTLKGRMDGVNSVIFSQDGQTLILGTNNSGVQLWRISDGAYLRTIGKSVQIISIAISPDGQTLAAFNGGLPITLWRISDGTLIRNLNIKGVRMSGQGNISFNKNGQTLALAMNFFDNDIAIWQASDGSLLKSLEWGDHDFISSISYSPDGKILASGSANGKINLWNVRDGKLLTTLENPAGVNSLVFSPDNRILASESQSKNGSGSIENTIRLWMVSDGTLLKSWDINYWTGSLAFSPGGQILASGSSDGVVRLWNVKDGTLIRNLVGHTNAVNSLAFSQDGKILASDSQDQTIRVWNIPDGQLLKILKINSPFINNTVFSPIDDNLLSAEENTIILWDPIKGEIIKTFITDKWRIFYATFSPDGKMLVSINNYNVMQIWNVEDGALLLTLNENIPGMSNNIVVSPDGTLIAEGSWYDGSIRLFGIAP